MKAIKEKLHDISGMRHAKAQAKEEARAEKEYAKARGKEAEMDVHKAKAAGKVVQHPAGQPPCTTVCPIRR
nr:late embryogenesis abundant protein 6 [Ipomoea batatas]